MTYLFFVVVKYYFIWMYLFQGQMFVFYIIYAFRMRNTFYFLLFCPSVFHSSVEIRNCL